MQIEIRAALPADELQLLALARHLNSVNLPADSAAISNLLRTSEQSFRGELPASRCKYVFIVCDADTGVALGTSTIVAQLGRPDAPYIYFDVDTEEKYSRDLTLHFEHSVLRLGFSYCGPTELAGLVVDPAFRQHPGRLGLCISYIRFLFIAANRALFQDELLAELLPPLEPDGTSHLWNALGRRFTNMTYRDADRLSHENKDFIRDLFPTQSVYVSLLDEAARNVVGKVGQQTRGVEKMLRRVGFKYADRVDPFDGGPHFVANTSDVSVVQQCKTLPCSVEPNGSSSMLVARLSRQAPFVLARPMSVLITDTTLGISEDSMAAFNAAPGTLLHAIPLP
jgi:arginine N-succinyltransferase